MLAVFPLTTARAGTVGTTVAPWGHQTYQHCYIIYTTVINIAQMMVGKQWVRSRGMYR